MRVKLILVALREKKYTKMNELAKILNVTDRTIRNEIKSINDIGVKKGFTVINTRGKGYSLEIYNKENFESYCNGLENFEESYDRDIRVKKIVIMFLLARDYITINSIANELGYSRSTVIKDIEYVEETINSFDLTLEKRSGFGVKIRGEEIKIRKMLAKYISDTENLNFDNKINNLYIRIEKKFIDLIIENNIKISNLAVENILGHLKILIIRFLKGNFLKSINYGHLNNKNYKIYEKISVKICNEIARDLDIDIPIEEIDYLTMHIILKSEYLIQDENFRTEIENETREILLELDDQFITDFGNDDELLNNLVLHVYSLINRARNNIQLNNPILNEINTRYPIIVSITIAFVDKLCERYKLILLKDEIGFIALHFATYFEKRKEKKLSGIKRIAVICSTGGGISYLIKLKLERIFLNASIESFSTIYTDQITSDKFDLVLKAIEFDKEFGIPTIDVKNFLDDIELQTIKDHLENNFSEEICKRNNEDKFEQIITFKKVQGGSRVNYIDFLKLESSILEGNGFVDAEFVDLVLERERKLSTAYEKEIAGPHAIKMNAIKNSINVIVFDEPINWGDKKVQIVFFITMKKGSLDIHKKVGKIMLKLIEKDRLRNEVINSANKREFMNLINKYI